MFVLEIPKGCWHLILSFMIKKHIECACVIVYFELGSHWLLNSAEDTPAKDDVVYGIPVVLAYIVWTRLGV